MNIDFIGINLNDIQAAVKETISYMKDDYDNKRYKDVVLRLMDVLLAVEYIEDELLKED